MTNHSESIGPEVRHAGSGRSAATGKPSPEAMRQLMTDTIASQFATLGEAAENCDVIVAAGALQFAARSIAQQRQHCSLNEEFLAKKFISYVKVAHRAQIVSPLRRPRRADAYPAYGERAGLAAAAGFQDAPGQAIVIGSALIVSEDVLDVALGLVDGGNCCGLAA